MNTKATASAAPKTAEHLVALDRFILATRDSGYKGTGSAVAELVDNSLQAGATKISVNVDVDSSDWLKVEVADNGCGMDPVTLAQALRFGGSSRFNDRSGLGRYGMGLPNSSFSQARRVEVVTWRSSREAWAANLDLDEIAQGTGDAACTQSGSIAATASPLTLICTPFQMKYRKLELDLPECIKTQTAAEPIPSLADFSIPQEPWLREIVQTTIELERVSGSVERPQLDQEWLDQERSNHALDSPLPAILLYFRPGDAIMACFDDECEYWGQETPEPNLIISLQPEDPESVRKALTVLETLMRVLVLTVRIKNLIEEREKQTCGSASTSAAT